MTTRLFCTTTSVGAEPIEELKVVRLVHSVEVDPIGYLQEGSIGAVVFVHHEGEAYEVEFTAPVAAVVTLSRADIEPTETTRDRVIASADGTRHRSS